MQIHWFIAASIGVRGVGMIRINAVWLVTELIDMRAGIDPALTRLVKVVSTVYRSI